MNPNKENEVKKCPFCGGVATLVTYEKDDVTHFSEKYAIRCYYGGDEQGCGAEGQINKIKELAVQAWNRRSPISSDNNEKREEEYPSCGELLSREMQIGNDLRIEQMNNLSKIQELEAEVKELKEENKKRTYKGHELLEEACLAHEKIERLEKELANWNTINFNNSNRLVYHEDSLGNNFAKIPYSTLGEVNDYIHSLESTIAKMREASQFALDNVLWRVPKYIVPLDVANQAFFMVKEALAYPNKQESLKRDEEVSAEEWPMTKDEFYKLVAYGDCTIHEDDCSEDGDCNCEHRALTEKLFNLAWKVFESRSAMASTPSTKGIK